MEQLKSSVRSTTAPPKPPRAGKVTSSRAIDSLATALAAAKSRPSRHSSSPEPARRELHIERPSEPSRPAPPSPGKVDADEVLSVLECPVCMELMAEPIYLCASGHSVCAACTPACRGLCPTCRGPLTGATRNYALEQLARSSTTPCGYAPVGCPERHLAPAARALHEAGCAFRPLSCPLRCGWSGARQELRQHAVLKHPRAVTAVEDPAVAALQWLIPHAGCFSSFRHAFFAFGHAFGYVKRFSMSDRRLYLLVQLFGPAEEAARYRYELSMEHERDGYESLCMARAVHHWTHEPKQVIQRRGCIVVDFETLVYYGKGRKTFKIYKAKNDVPVRDDRVFVAELDAVSGNKSS